jgi:hypothetical protein
MAVDENQDDPEDRHDTPALAATDIPQEQAVEQRPVPFLDDELAAALTPGGSIYVTLPGICTALGLNRQAQLRRILRTPSLNRSLRIIPLQTRGGVQRVNCLRVDKVALWLAGVETNSVNPRFRDKIEAYQEELAPVAMRVFLRVMDVPDAPQVTSARDMQAAGQVAQLVEQIDAMSGAVSLMREHLAALLALPGQVQDLSEQMSQAVTMLESLAARQETTEAQLAQVDERTQRLTPAHTRAVQEMVDRMVRETRRLPTPLTYAIIYGRLKHRFRVGSYKEVNDSRFDEVMACLLEELNRATAGEAPEQGSLF